MKHKGLLILIFIIAVCVIGGCDDETDDGAYIDWGDGYYWNSSTHQVEKTLW